MDLIERYLLSRNGTTLSRNSARADSFSYTCDRMCGCRCEYCAIPEIWLRPLTPSCTWGWRLQPS